MHPKKYVYALLCFVMGWLSFTHVPLGYFTALVNTSHKSRAPIQYKDVVLPV